MNLKTEHAQEVLGLVRALMPEAEVFVFGSRAKDAAKKASDLDLLIKASRPLTDLELSALKEAFSLSNLPFFVDVQDYSRVDPEFLKRIQGDLKSL